MTFSADDIEAEHRAALATLTDVQRRALERVRNARQQARFNGRYPEENLRAIFDTEAAARTRKAEAVEAEMEALHRAAA